MTWPFHTKVEFRGPVLFTMNQSRDVPCGRSVSHRMVTLNISKAFDLEHHKTLESNLKAFAVGDVFIYLSRVFQRSHYKVKNRCTDFLVFSFWLSIYFLYRRKQHLKMTFPSFTDQVLRSLWIRIYGRANRIDFNIYVRNMRSPMSSAYIGAV